MPADEAQNVIVPVKRYDVNLTLDDIVTPLLDVASHQASARTADADKAAELEPHLRRLSELAAQLKAVVGEINRIDPTLLAPGRRRTTGE
ncbi:MAG TPA: hypothetical protein VL996_01055 [Methylocella sp.]|nr:hypothetical protein [Methylocella sp.]